MVFPEEKISKPSSDEESFYQIVIASILSIMVSFKKIIKNNIILQLVATLTSLVYAWKYFRKRKTDRIDGMEVPHINDNFDLSID